jgi:hypothetical protein
MAEKTILKRTEFLMENLLLSSRWLLAPFYFGLALSLIVLLIKFLLELLHGCVHIKRVRCDPGAPDSCRSDADGITADYRDLLGIREFRFQDGPFQPRRSSGVDGYDRLRRSQAQDAVVDRGDLRRAASASVHVYGHGDARARKGTDVAGDHPRRFRRLEHTLGIVRPDCQWPRQRRRGERSDKSRGPKTNGH